MAFKARTNAPGMPQSGDTIRVYDTGTLNFISGLKAADTSEANLANPFTISAGDFWGFEPPNSNRVDVFWVEGDRYLIKDVNLRDSDKTITSHEQIYDHSKLAKVIVLENTVYSLNIPPSISQEKIDSLIAAGYSIENIKVIFNQGTEPTQQEYDAIKALGVFTRNISWFPTEGFEDGVYGSVSITEGDYTTTGTVNLVLSSNGTQMLIANTADFAGVNWEIFAETKPWTLTTGDGVKTVYVKFRDAALLESLTYSAQITLDATAPVTTADPAGGTYTEAQNVTLSATDATSGVHQILFTTDGVDPVYPASGSTLVYSGSIYVGTTATLKFRARDNAGNLEAVKTQVYTIEAPSANEPPTAPVIAYYGGDQTTIGVQLTEASVDPEDGLITTYEVYANGVKNGADRTNWTVGNNQPIEGLASNTNYNVTARGKDSEGALSTASNTVTTATLPAVPTGLQVTGGSLSISGSFNHISGNASKTYTIQMATTEGGVYSDIPGQPQAGNTFTVTGLDPSATRWLRVRANNSSGSSEYSAAVSATTLEQNEAPTVVTGVTADAYLESGQGFTLSWSAASDSDGYVDYYRIYRAGVLFADNVAVLAHNITGQNPGSTANWTVSAVDDKGLEGPSSDPLGVLMIPGVPTNTSLVAGDGEVTMGFTAPSGSTSVNARYTMDGTIPTKTTGMSLSGITNGQKITNLTNDVEVKIIYWAVNASGAGVGSTVLSATPAVFTGPLVVFDDFNRSDRLLNTDPEWNGRDTFAISNNQLVLGSSQFLLTMIHRSEIFPDNQFAVAKITSLSEEGGSGPAVRVTDDYFGYLMSVGLEEGDEGGEWYLSITRLQGIGVGNDPLRLGAYVIRSTPWPYTHFQLEAEGNSLRGYGGNHIDGPWTLLITRTDDNYQFGTVGLGGSASVINGPIVSFGAFKGGAL